MSDTEYVFVYGTLRPPRHGTSVRGGSRNPHIDPYVVSSIPARLAGADLFDTGGFPAARPGRGTVVGDLLTVDSRGVAMMDMIEGHPRFFYRDRVEVDTGDGPVEAWVYWGPVDLAARSPLIPSGDWFDREVHRRW